jgi:hypothetical protein
VRTDGSDSNNGLTDSSGGAFLTIQKAVDTIAGLDINGKTITIQVRSGTYTGAVILKNVPGFLTPGTLIIIGDESTPSNVVISTTNATCFYADMVTTVWDLRGLKLQTTTSGHCLVASSSIIRFQNLNFGACAGYHLISVYSSTLLATGNYSISGAAGAHMYSASNSNMSIQSVTVTVTANISIGVFAASDNGGVIFANANTYSLGGFTVTGTRYSASGNSVIFTNGGGANYFPGTVAGSTATGGQYI